MHFQAKMPENSRNNIFRDKQTRSKGSLMFLDVKVLFERQQLGSWAEKSKEAR